MKFKERIALEQCGYIATTKNQVAKVDLEDLPYLSPFKWTSCGGYPARRGEKTRMIFMHDVIMWSPEGYQLDHINGDKHDNRKINLRVATRSENSQNRPLKRGGSYTSKYRGVHWSKTERKWIAQITKDYIPRRVGSFDSEDDAARAYDAVATQAWGEFAKLNFSS